MLTMTDKDSPPKKNHRDLKARRQKNPVIEPIVELKKKKTTKSITPTHLTINLQ